MHPLPVLLTTFWLALGAATGRAQEPAPPGGHTSIQRSAHLLTPQGDGLFGLGATYTATFDRHGMTFVPALGTRVETNQRLQVALRSIRRGGFELPVQHGVAPDVDGTTAFYRRSADVRECYDVRADGVEQSFRFTALSGHGDLVVRCTLGGELASAVVTAQGGGLQFVSPELGGVAIGNVTGIAADGARCDGGMRLVDGELELSLPATFVDHAALPLVLDPLFGARIDFTNSPGGEVDADVAYGAASGDYFVVWALTQSTTSADVVGRFFNPTTGLGPAVLLGHAGAVQRPRVAYHAYQNRYLVVWEKGTNWLGVRQITSRIVEGNRTLGSSLDLTSTTENCTHSALCGNPGGTSNDDGGLVVYRKAGAGLQVLPYVLPLGTATLVPGAAVTLDADPSADLPRISKAGTGTRVVSYAIAGYVRARPIGQNGAPLGGGFSIATGGGNVLASDVDGQGQNFLLAHETVTANGKEITARMLTWSAANQTLALASSGALTANAVDDRDPQVALLGPKFGVVWTQTLGFLDTAVKARPLALVGCTFCGAEATLTGPRISESMPAIASKRAGGDTTSPDALIVCQSVTQLPPIIADITATQFSVAQGAAASTQLWAGCGASVTLSTIGTFAIGNSSFALRGQVANPTPFSLFLFGFGAQPLGCGSCTAVNSVAAGFASMASGSATYPLPVPCNSAFLGFSVDAQVAVLGASTGACPAYSTLSLSEARRFTVVE